MNTILVGSDLPKNLHDELVIRAKEVSARLEEPVQVLELVEFENKRILQTRAELDSRENIQSDLENKERREQLKKDYLTFINRVKYRQAHIKLLKSETDMSWRQFRVLLDNWELFGFITYLDKEKTIVNLIENEDDNKENILKGLANDIDLLKMKIRSVKSQFTPEEQKKLSAFERKLKLETNVNR